MLSLSVSYDINIMTACSSQFGRTNKRHDTSRDSSCYDTKSMTRVEMEASMYTDMSEARTLLLRRGNKSREEIQGCMPDMSTRDTTTPQERNIMREVFAKILTRTRFYMDNY